MSGSKAKYEAGQVVRAVFGPPTSMQPDGINVGKLGTITEVHSFFGQEFYYRVHFKNQEWYDSRDRFDFIDEVCLEAVC